jgi:hypothetical protein
MPSIAVLSLIPKCTNWFKSMETPLGKNTSSNSCWQLY